MRTYGTSYRLAHIFFPKSLREHVRVLYAFVRIPDNIVDAVHLSGSEKKERLAYIMMTYHDARRGDKVTSTIPRQQEWLTVLASFLLLQKAYTIPSERVEAFFSAMQQDLEKTHYADYAALQSYMYGSAEVVGLMMCRLIGYDRGKEVSVFYHAQLLGEAMQYTNFLRDIVEDWHEYGRIYMPADRLAEYGLVRADIEDYVDNRRSIDERWHHFLAHQVVLCKSLYQEANRGIPLLAKEGRKAVWYASHLYEAILDKIVEKNYASFTHDMHTTTWDKVYTVAKAWRQYS